MTLTRIQTLFPIAPTTRLIKPILIQMFQLYLRIIWQVTLTEIGMTSVKVLLKDANG
nr:unnamed protein product [Callosobruchus chinensis]